LQLAFALCRDFTADFSAALAVGANLDADFAVVGDIDDGLA